ncbi:MAG TPA: phosphate ABC transporter ATP-binding protein [Verrucomicrobiales bacterium]|nr:phosphate ABC transporter ATP-binding protein [Verrucomicrobiales bacterium]
MDSVPGKPQQIIEISGLQVHAGPRQILRNIKLGIPGHSAFALVGPSGAGKSTLLRCINRLVELTPGLRVSGEVRLHGRLVTGPGVDVDELRCRIGMLFQQPVVFPKSVFQNVVFGTRHHGRVHRRDWPEVAERALTEASLWNEVKDRLHEPALRLSVGQQQRLCLARAMAVDPEVILMDEPTSALDPRSTEAIEELILRLKTHRTIVVVTHNLDQARRVADWVSCLCVRDGVGEVAESGCCSDLFEKPQVGEVAAFFRSASRYAASVEGPVTPGATLE